MRWSTSEMASLVVLVRTAPFGHLEAAEGVRHLSAHSVLGFERTAGVFCDDGVWALRAGQQPAGGFISLAAPLEEVAAGGVPLYAERASLERRNLQAKDLIDGVTVLDSVEELLADADAVLVF